MASFTMEFHKQHSRKITDLIKDWAIDLRVLKYRPLRGLSADAYLHL